MILASGEFTGSETWWFLIRHAGPAVFLTLLLIVTSFLLLLYCILCGHRVQSFVPVCAVLGICYFTFMLSVDIPAMKTFPPAALGPSDGDILAAETQSSIIAFAGAASSLLLYAVILSRAGIIYLLSLLRKTI
jgi:hypothetical protein